MYQLSRISNGFIMQINPGNGYIKQKIKRSIAHMYLLIHDNRRWIKGTKKNYVCVCVCALRHIALPYLMRAYTHNLQ